MGISASRTNTHEVLLNKYISANTAILIDFREQNDEYKGSISL